MVLTKIVSIILFIPRICQENKKLRMEIKQAKDQLADFIKISKENEKKQAVLDSVGLEILSTNSFDKLCDILLWQTDIRFQWHKSILILAKNIHYVENLVNDYELDRLYKNRIKIIDTDKVDPQLNALMAHVHVGSDVINRFDWILSDVDGGDLLVSGAFLPLTCGGERIGMLLLASRHPQCFKNGSGTDLLCKFADMVAVAIKNCLNHKTETA